MCGLPLFVQKTINCFVDIGVFLIFVRLRVGDVSYTPHCITPTENLSFIVDKTEGGRSQCVRFCISSFVRL